MRELRCQTARSGLELLLIEYDDDDLLADRVLHGAPAILHDTAKRAVEHNVTAGTLSAR